MTICTSGINQRTELATQIYSWFLTQYNVKDANVEVFHTDLTDDYVSGWCEQDEDNDFIISIHYGLKMKDYCITLMHELVHVWQTLNGKYDEDEREREAYYMEDILYDNWCASSQGVHQTPTDPHGCAIL